MRVTAVVVTYNRLKLLKECIEALLAQTYPEMDILVVNNNSTDGTQEYLDELTGKNKKVKNLSLPENIGGSGGFYEGMKCAIKDNPDWLWIMDDDTIPEKDCVMQLL